jgi:hypothetical protein
VEWGGSIDAFGAPALGIQALWMVLQKLGADGGVGVFGYDGWSWFELWVRADRSHGVQGARLVLGTGCILASLIGRPTAAFSIARASPTVILSSLCTPQTQSCLVCRPTAAPNANSASVAVMSAVVA